MVFIWLLWDIRLNKTERFDGFLTLCEYNVVDVSGFGFGASSTD